MFTAVALFVSFLVNLFVMAVFAKAFSNTDFATLEKAVSMVFSFCLQVERNQGRNVWNLNTHMY